MRTWMILWVTVVSVMLLSGCGSDEAVAETVPAAAAGSNQAVAAASAQTGEDATQPQRGEPFQSAYLTNTYTNALPVTLQLALGTLTLEDSENAVTGEQAKKLLLFYQALQSEAIQSATERNAIFKQIEATMTQGQMAAIAAQQLTGSDLTAWATANNITLPPDAAGRAGGGGQGRQGQGQGRFANLSEEERTKLRQELQSLTPEERRARLRELGIEVPEGDGQGQGGQGQGGQGQGGQNQGGQGRRGQGGQGQGGQGQGGQAQGGRFNLLLEPVVNLLTARSAQ